MAIDINNLNQPDQETLDDLATTLELSDGTTIVFAIAPESAPNHPVVEQLKSVLNPDEFQIENFFYSQESLIAFLYALDKRIPVNPDAKDESKRPVIMAFGIEQLPRPRILKELKRLNLGREALFSREIVLIFWLNKRGFIDTFRGYAPDFWDWREKVVRFTTRPPLNPLLYPYLESLIAENSYLKMSGVMQVQRQVDIFLDQVYVSLKAERQQQVTEFKGGSKLGFETQRYAEVGAQSRRGMEFAPSEMMTKTVTHKVDLAEAVGRCHYSVILGDPGAGKTTLLRYLALHFAMAQRDGKVEVLVENVETYHGTSQGTSGNAGNKDEFSQSSVTNPESLGNTRFPVFLRVADYAERLVKQPELSLLGFLEEFYQQWEADVRDVNDECRDAPWRVSTLLCDKMRQGECLVLLDGLDEVFNQTSRQQIVQQIEAFVTDYPDNKYVITSRIAGYRDVKLGSRFTQFTITQMEFEQVERFLRRWCLAIEKAQKPEETEEVWRRDAQKEAGELLEAIHGNEGVKRLTGNPLLLTILALIHRNGSRLPNRRVELYALAVKTLIEDWQLSKNLPDAPQVMLRESEVIELLAPLAYWMHEEKPSGLITQAEAEAQLGEKLAELNDEDAEADSVKKAVQKFLRRVRETTGLFVERAPNVYGFMHLTFEEYFVARYIADNDVSEILDIIQKHQDDARWQEPILLALGYLGIHSPKRVNRLLERLFKGLEDYQPVLGEGEIQVKNYSSSETILQWSVLAEDGTISWCESDSILQELLFAGQVVAEVEVNSRIRSKVIEKLVITLLQATDSENDTNESTEKIIKLLRQIDQFNKKDEVIEKLKPVANNLQLSNLMRALAQLVILYVYCGEPKVALINYLNNLVNQLNPLLFIGLKGMSTEFGEDITPVLETIRQSHKIDKGSQKALDFTIAISYIRPKKYKKAILILEKIVERFPPNIRCFIYWGLADSWEAEENYKDAIGYYKKAYRELSNYFQAEDIVALLHDIGNSYKKICQYPEAIYYYQQSLELYEQLDKQQDVANLWYWLGDCYRDWGQYEQAIKCQQKCLAIRQQLDNPSDIALAYYQFGRIYQDWGKYEEAIAHHKQSLELYEQLDKQQDVANLWYWLAACYRDWGQYEKAIECEQKDLAIRQQLDDQTNIADAYYQFGRIYQDWGKYEEAIAHYQQSLELNKQLDKQQDVATLWCNIADCYRNWGQYEKAIECEQKDLAIRQQLDDQPSIADAYYQLGRIYQEWGKYEEAIAHYQQSLELKEQLGKQQNVASLLFLMAVCYRDWGQYEKAIECEQKDLAICQQLDNQSDIALAYFQLGRIYQDWGKYEEAIAHYQQSLELYEHLDKQKDVANQWYNLADCYRNWGQYEKAIECEQQDLAIRQQLDDQPNIALAYYQLGRIYQDWGKYEEAIAHYQPSIELNKQLDKQKDVANQWYRLAVCYRDWGQYEKAIECEHKDLAIRQQLDDQSRIASAYFQLGRIYQDWGKYEEAIAHYQQSLELYEQLDKQKDVANQWYRLAVCYRDWGQYEKAIDCEQKCLAIRQQLDDQPRIASAYYQLGRIYQDWGKYEEAIAHHQQSLELYEQLDKQKNVANRWYNLADCYRDWGQYEKAIECEQKDLAIRQQLDNQSDIALAYYQLGRIYQDWGKYEEAIAHHQQSLELYEQLDKQKNVANRWYNLADCYRNWGQYEKAIECEQKDLAIRQQLDDQARIALAYYQLGWIYQGWGKYEEAIAHYQQSLELYEHLDKQQDVANQWYWLAACYRDWGQYEKAIECEQKDLAIRQQLDDQSDIALAYYQLGRIYQDWGKYEEAIAHHHQSRELYEQLDKHKDVADSWYWLADCYRDWGQYEKAIECEQKDLAIRQQLDDQSRIALAYYQLGRIYQDWGKYKEAITHHQQSRNLHQQIGHNERTARSYRYIGKTQRLLAQTTSDTTAALTLLSQAEENIRQSIQINTKNDYKKNQGYDYIALALIYAERFHQLPADDFNLSEQINQFQTNYTLGLTHLRQLGQTVDSAEETLDIARAYLRIDPIKWTECTESRDKTSHIWEPLNQAETLTRAALETFQAYNRGKLQAAAQQLLEEIHQRI